jgi:hypothetical protein
VTAQSCQHCGWRALSEHFRCETAFLLAPHLIASVGCAESHLYIIFISYAKVQKFAQILGAFLRSNQQRLGADVTGWPKSLPINKPAPAQLYGTYMNTQYPPIRTTFQSKVNNFFSKKKVGFCVFARHCLFPPFRGFYDAVTRQIEPWCENGESGGCTFLRCPSWTRKNERKRIFFVLFCV